MKTLKYIPIFLFIIASSFTAKAEPRGDYVYISGTRFTYPLLEKWISEYKKENPTAKIKLQYSKQPNDSVNLRVVAHSISQNEIKPNETYIQVSKYALLPIANERNNDLKKAFKKGLNSDELKKIFFVDPESLFEEEDKDKKKETYTVYTRANKADASTAFASYYGYQQSEIKGKKISGEDQFLTLAVQKDTTGLTYNYPGYVFDITSRQILKGIKVVPLDINGNGKIDKEELLAYENLDQFTDYLEKFQDNRTAVPVDYVSFVVSNDKSNKTIRQFAEWVLNEGQKYNHSFGFLNSNTRQTAMSLNLANNL
jgi:phosphate transport system substrate-binding protein